MYGACLSPRGKGGGEKRGKQTKQNRKVLKQREQKALPSGGAFERRWALGLPASPSPWHLELSLVKTPDCSSTEDLIRIHAELEPSWLSLLFGLWEIPMGYTAASSPHTHQNGHSSEPDDTHGPQGCGVTGTQSLLRRVQRGTVTVEDGQLLAKLNTLFPQNSAPALLAFHPGERKTCVPQDPDTGFIAVLLTIVKKLQATKMSF